MIQQIIKKINCPNCNVENEVILWEKVNVTMNPDLKEQLFEETINNLQCGCGYKGRVDIPLYYNDAKKKFFVYLVPDFPMGAKEEDELLRNLDGETLHILDPGYDNKMRVVYDYFLMLEKIRIFDEDLDDRGIEGCKILARTQLKLMEGRAAFDRMDGDQLVFQFFAKEEKKASSIFEIPKAMYEEVMELIKVKDRLDPHGFRVIDVKYAVRMLMQKEKPA